MTDTLQRHAVSLMLHRQAEAVLHGELVQALRKQTAGRGKAKALARAIGISEQYLSDLLRSRRQISDATLRRIVQVKR